MYQEIDFKVNHDELGGVSGFTLMGIGKTEAECFCLSFITAQQKDKASITFQEGKIIFTHRGVSMSESNGQYGLYGMHEGGVFSSEISDEEAKKIDDLLNLREAYKGMNIRVREEFAWGKGFTLYVAQT